MGSEKDRGLLPLLARRLLSSAFDAVARRLASLVSAPACAVNFLECLLMLMTFPRRMRGLASILLLLCARGGIDSLAVAAPIIWGTPQTISGDTDVATAGTLVYAYNIGGSGVGPTTIIQTNYETGDGTIPGGEFDAAGNILSTNLASSSHSGSFYRETLGYPVEVSRLFDGALGSLGSAGLGGDGRFTVMPNVATIQFDLDTPFDITAIRTYASWDSGRDGQQYTVTYATVSNPSTYTTLIEIARFDVTDFPQWEDSDWETGDPIIVSDESTATTLVALTSPSGVLAEDVVSLRFVFNGVENGGTAYREIQVTAVPEPATYAMALAGLACGGYLVSRRRRRA
jgi:hypothetical protein